MPSNGTAPITGPSLTTITPTDCACAWPTPNTSPDYREPDARRCLAAPATGSAFHSRFIEQEGCGEGA